MDDNYVILDSKRERDAEKERERGERSREGERGGRQTKRENVCMCVRERERGRKGVFWE